MPEQIQKPYSIDTLRQIMCQLRDPETGCPWDIKQDFTTISPYTVEEAYEVADAIARNDMAELQEELGDLLLQVIFHSQIANEQNAFNFDDVITSICEKMIRRHPHVFGKVKIQNATDQSKHWEQLKAVERAQKVSDSAYASSALDGITLALPSVLRAHKLQNRAAETGFDWSDTNPVFAKLDEEITETHAAIEKGDIEHISEEIGDVLFVCVNLARKLGVDAEQALNMANKKFERRFRMMEKMAEEKGEQFSELSLEIQEVYWREVKLQE